VPYADYSLDFINPRAAGLRGDGTTDDTSSFATVLATGRAFRGIPGDTYLIDGGLTVSTAGQLIDLRGCTVKLKNSASSKGMLTVSANRARVIGGYWDGNKANNATGDPYGHFAVNLAAGSDGSSVERAYSINSFGIGFKGAAATKTDFLGNRVDAPGLYGIYVEGSNAANYFDTRVLDNVIDTSSVAGAYGIMVTGQAAPFTNEMYRWLVSRNKCYGHTSGTVTGISIRGYQGGCHENEVYGYLLSISVDIANRCTITNNRCMSPNSSGTSLGIEANGSYNVIEGNTCEGHTYGIIASGVTAMDYNKVRGNTIINPTSKGIYFQATVGGTARHLDISGNTIIAATAVQGVNLTRDCKYTKINGNTFVGPGSGTANGRAIYLDTVNSDVSINGGNKFTGWERPVGIYNVAAVAQDRITFNGNDCGSDMPSDSVWLNLEGSATFGTGVAQLGNTSSGGAATDYLDRGANILRTQSNAYATPEANVTAGIGSVWINTNGGAATTLFVKETGTGNTGWAGK
jgi:hypothetical protein